jgi:prepilin-type N-terminal cleavage/methylation domain-containing protein/prepilin-type processing-associated H-X9-DG protein
MRRKSAFTLVELLVVIGIIALLISILLPALNKARRAAATVQCSSNMRQVAMGLLTYINANKGVFPPTGAPVMAGVYPNGWWWANEMVRQKYINAGGLNVYPKAGSAVTDKRFNRTNVFRCPEGTDEDINTSPSAPAGDFPTDTANNGYAILNDSACATEGFGIPSWYQLNTRVGNNVGDMRLPGGKRASPFVWFNSNTPTDGALVDPRLKRVMGYVRKSSELIMVVEAANPNWYDQNGSTSQPPLYMRRLGARHGKRTGDGRNAWTNFAYFDGHVGLYATEPFQIPQWNADNFTRETIFWVGKQK